MKLVNIAKQIKEKDMFEGFNETDLDEDYPQGFSFDELKAQKSYAGKKKYIETHLGKALGSGSARSVYRVDENKVLKLAKNRKGLAQNAAESSWYNDSYFDSILARVLDVDQDDYWVEMELALKVKKSDFERLWGISLEDVFKYVSNKYAENNPSKTRGRYKYPIDPTLKEKLDEEEFPEVTELIDFMLNGDIEPGDFGKLSTWGRVFREDGEYIVLVDFGLTSNVAYTYY